jgi:inorganic pyrophosphatase/exopolyphosphatase
LGSYDVGKIISLSNYIKNFVRSEEESITFNEVDYLSDFYEKSKQYRHTNYPILNGKKECRGVLTLTDTNNIERKQVMLVDHNNFSQSVEGLEEADIIEVVDHHNIGDIVTKRPINFRNSNCGCCSTMIFEMFKENNIVIPSNIAGLLSSAIISDTLQNRLQDYITTYRTQKAKKDLQYYKKLFIESKKEYIEAQHKYAGYSDANEDPLLQSYKTKEEQYENEMQLKYNAYAQWASQLQAAKAKVQERTPAFTIIQKPTTSNKASSTPRMFIVIIYTCIGIAIDAIWVLILKDRKKIK